MLSILEFEKRSLEGPVMKPKEFDLALAKKVKELVKIYDIKWNPEELIVDDETADKVFKAAVDFLVEIGLYNQDTQRVIKWTKEEVLDMVQEINEQRPIATFGKGKDLITIAPRKPGDGKKPVVWVTSGRATTLEKLTRAIELHAGEESLQGIGIPNSGLESANGVVPRNGAPSEIYLCLREEEAMREGLRRAGRPNLHLGVLPSAGSEASNLACLGAGMREPHNTQIAVHIMAEQKIDWTRLNLSCVMQERGISAWLSANSLVGGLAGNAAGTAVVVTANVLAQISYTHAKLGHIFVCDVTGYSSGRDSLWATSAGTLALNRNLDFPIGNIPTDTGVNVYSWEETLLGDFAHVVSMTASGGAYKAAGAFTPLEFRITEEVCKAVAGMDREEANKIMNAILTEMKNLPRDGEKLTLSQVKEIFPYKYDIETLKPKQEYVNICKRVVDLLKKSGIPISDELDLDN